MLSYWRGGEVWQMVCSLVTTPSWMLCATAPDSDLSSAGDILADESRRLTIIGVSVLIPLLILMLAMIYYCDRRAARPIVKRLQSFTRRVDTLMTSDGKQLRETNPKVPIIREGRPPTPATDLGDIQIGVDMLRGAMRINALESTNDQDKLIQQLSLVEEGLRTALRDAQTHLTAARVPRAA